MTHDIKVHVVAYPDRKNFYMRYQDPLTGKQVARSTGIAQGGAKQRQAAEREAAKWEAQLQEGRYKAPSKVTWDEFRGQYEEVYLPSLKAGTTDRKVQSVLNAVEELLAPVRLADLTTARISELQKLLRKKKLAESTIKGHMAHLQAALNWAKRQGLLVEVPDIDMPRRAKRSRIMKGRPITTEEFERMQAAVPKILLCGRRKRRTQIVCKIARLQCRGSSAEEHKAELRQHDREAAAACESWRHYLLGMWLSGLRLAESLELYWDRDDKLHVDLSHEYVMLRVPAELEKGASDRLLPIAPEFAEFLLAVPVAERTGRVFEPAAKRARAPLPLPHRVGQIASQIGEAAGVKVATDAGTGKVKFASLHDLRRSFGERWSKLVMPPALKELMRHESLETTMRYYVGADAQQTAALLYAARGNTWGNSAEPEAQNAKQPAPQTTVAKRVAR